jgi:glycosyltransferase involved in cell wall biosynthesis
MSQRVTPAASVIVPTCARTTLLRRALESIRAQSFRDWDCWIVNDSPADAGQVEALLAALGDERLHLLSNPQRLGPSASRNAGIGASAGAILAFLDDDDQWLPGKLERHVAEHRSCGAPAVVYSESAHVWEEGLFRPFRLTPGPPPPDLVEAIREERFWPGGPPVVTVSRACFEQVGAFDVELPCREDQDLMLRLASRFPLRYVPHLTVLVTEHARERASIDARYLIAGLERLGPSWGVSEIRQRHWARDRALMYEIIGLLDAGTWRRLVRLLDFGRIARPPGFGWLRWAWWGLREHPRSALRLLGLALGGRAFCWLNRRRPFASEVDAELRMASVSPTALSG